MSLGWQCESALLPSNSKPIHVDGKSLVGLKALLYDEQQRSKGKDGHDGRRNAKSESSSSKHQIFTSSTKSKNVENVGTGKKENRRQQEGVEDVLERDVLAALTAKSKLYEEISRGKVQLQSDLVNFEDKVEHDTGRTPAQPVQPSVKAICLVPPPKPPSMPNPAKKAELSCEDMQHLSNSSAERRAGSPQVASQPSQPQWNWSTTYGPGATSNAPGADRDHTVEYKSQHKQEIEAKRIIEDRIRAESDYSASRAGSERHDGNPESRVSEAARVKTQWEKTLNSSARNFLDQVHDDAVTQRAASSNDVGQKRSSREEKMELIRQKRSKMTN